MDVRSDWAKLAAFVLVVVAASFANWEFQSRVDRHISDSQYEGCLRGNLLRAEINHDNAATKQFLILSANLLAKQPDPLNRKRARQYRAFADNYHLVAVPNCRSVIYNP